MSLRHAFDAGNSQLLELLFGQSLGMSAQNVVDTILVYIDPVYIYQLAKVKNKAIYRWFKVNNIWKKLFVAKYGQEEYNESRIIVETNTVNDMWLFFAYNIYVLFKRVESIIGVDRKNYIVATFTGNAEDRKYDQKNYQQFDIFHITKNEIPKIIYGVVEYNNTTFLIKNGINVGATLFHIIQTVYAQFKNGSTLIQLNQHEIPGSGIRCKICDDPTPLFRCGQCLTATYCSIECQTVDWGKHQDKCL